MKPPLVLLLLCLLGSIHAQTAVTVLTELYNATNGAGWINSTNWLVGNPCGWFGITCDGTNITAINLDDNGLVGTLPQNLELINSLVILSVRDNSGIHGDLPQWSNLTSLQILYLSNTSLSGALPAWVALLPDLASLSLSQTDLGGPIPEEWCSMPSLSILDLGDQPIAGELPDCIGNITSLSTLRVLASNLTGSIPLSIGNLTNLENMDLSFNLMTGTIPTIWSRVTKLKLLYLNDNGLTGGIPASMNSLLNLEELHLRNNELSGTISNMQALTKLQYLGLENNNLTGTIPEWLRHMLSLSYLGLACNNFLAPLPKWLESNPERADPPMIVDLGCNFNITSLPKWCLEEGRCGPTACEASCQRPPSTGNLPVSKTVVIAFLGFVCLLLIGNIILLTVYIRRKIKYRNVIKSELVPLIQ